MEWLKKNGDRFALLVVAIVAILGSGMMIAKSLSFSEDFVYEHVTGDDRKREVPPTGAESVGQSLEVIGSEFDWRLPSLADKQEVPLFKSVVLIQKGSEIFDLSKTNSPPLRPPMTNAFLLEHSLDYTRTDVGGLDPDGDGFSNAEEFFGVNGVSTDPADAESHPPLTNKLFVKNRIEIPYLLWFSSGSDEPFQMGEKRDGGRVTRLFVNKDTLFFDRFTIVGHRTENIFDERINVNREVGVLTVRDSVTGENIDLVQGKEYNLPSYIAVFLYTWKVDAEIQVRKGEVFKIQGDPRSFKLLEIMESEAWIVPSNDAGEEIPGSSKIRIQSLIARGSAPVTPPADVPVTPPADVPVPPADAPVTPPTDAPLPPTDAPPPPADAPPPPADALPPPIEAPLPPIEAPLPPADAPLTPPSGTVPDGS